MTRISRISTPRATLAALALLIVVMTGFGVFVDGADGTVAEGAGVAHETAEQPATEPHRCWLTSHLPLAAIDGPARGNRHVRL